MGILAVHYKRQSKQHRRLHISDITCTILLLSFQFWSLLYIDMIQNKVNGASELFWRPKHTLRVTREAKFENLTFLPNNSHFLLQKHKYAYIYHLGIMI